MMNIVEKLNDIINSILETNVVINNQTKFSDLPEWDSVVQMTFLVTVENEFNISIDIGEALEAETIGEFSRCIMKE